MWQDRTYQTLKAGLTGTFFKISHKVLVSFSLKRGAASRGFVTWGGVTVLQVAEVGAHWSGSIGPNCSRGPC